MSYCKPCFSNAKCRGGKYKVVIDKYYWRSDNLSDVLFYCERVPERCLGNDTCAVGYTGTFCELCDT